MALRGYLRLFKRSIKDLAGSTSDDILIHGRRLRGAAGNGPQSLRWGRAMLTSPNTPNSWKTLLIQLLSAQPPRVCHCIAAGKVCPRPSLRPSWRPSNASMKYVTLQRQGGGLKSGRVCDRGKGKDHV